MRGPNRIKQNTQAQQRLWLKVAALALPVAIQILLQSFLGVADVVMVSGLGAEAVAAVGLSTKLHFLVLVFMIGVASAGAILTAQYIGAKDMPSCQRTLAMTLFVGAVLSTPFLLAFFMGTYWLNWVNPDSGVVAFAVSYLSITAPVVLITQVVVVYESCLRSIGTTIAPLVIGALVVALNVALNYVLIFGHFGFPELGVEGAAWGTLIARLVQLIIFLAWLYLSRHSFALSLTIIKRACSWVNLRPFVAFSLPLVMNNAIWGAGNAAYHIAVGFAGTQALAVMGAMAPIESAFFALFIGLASASAVLVGQSLGAGHVDEAWRLCKIFDRLALSLALGFSLILWLLKDYLVACLGGLDHDTVTLLTGTLSVFCLVVTIKVVNMTRILGVLRAGGDTRFCLIVDSLVMWGIGLPIFIFGVCSGWSFVYLYALMALEDALKLLPIRFRVKRRYWIKNLTHSF